MHCLAYLDASSGSLVVQTLVTGAGAAVFLKLGWSRLAGAFRQEEE